MSNPRASHPVYETLATANSLVTLSHNFIMITHSEHAYHMIKWRIGHTHLSMHCTRPRVHNCQDNAKFACYKMEWIYTQTKREQGSLELALENRQKD